MSNLENYNEIRKFLEEEPILKNEFEELRNSLEILADNFSRDEFEAQCDEYLEFLEFLSEIVTLPKNKKIYF